MATTHTWRHVMCTRAAASNARVISRGAYSRFRSGSPGERGAEQVVFLSLFSSLFLSQSLCLSMSLSLSPLSLSLYFCLCLSAFLSLSFALFLQHRDPLGGSCNPSASRYLYIFISSLKDFTRELSLSHRQSVHPSFPLTYARTRAHTQTALLSVCLPFKHRLARAHPQPQAHIEDSKQHTNTKST